MITILDRYRNSTLFCISLADTRLDNARSAQNEFACFVFLIVTIGDAGMGHTGSGQTKHVGVVAHHYPFLVQAVRELCLVLGSEHSGLRGCGYVQTPAAKSQYTASETCSSVWNFMPRKSVWNEPFRHEVSVRADPGRRSVEIDRRIDCPRRLARQWPDGCRSNKRGPHGHRTASNGGSGRESHPETDRPVAGGDVPDSHARASNACLAAAHVGCNGYVLPWLCGGCNAHITPLYRLFTVCVQRNAWSGPLRT